MSLVVPEFVVPSEEMLSILENEALAPDTQPALVDDDLLERRVAVATAYEHEGDVRYHGAVHIGRISVVRASSGIVHLSHREAPAPTDTTFVLSENYHTLIAPDAEIPNRTQLFPVRSLFYVLPQLRGQRA